MWTGTVKAQETAGETESELWTGFTYKWKLSKKWRVEAEQQLRLDEDLTRFDATFTEVGARYKVNGFFTLKGQYRYTVESDDRNEYRWSLDADLEWDLKNSPLDIGFRSRIQDTRVSYTGQKVTYLRNQLVLDYNLSKWVDPFIEYESFYRFNTKMEFRNNRYTAGLEWKLNKRWDLDTFYRLDQEVNVKEPDREHIVGIMFSYQMK